MSISQALATAGSGLGAASKRASVVSSNISNALTPGYVRREVSTAERVVGGNGAGVEIVGVRRAQDSALTASRRASEADSIRDQTVANVQDRLSTVLGGPDDEYAFFRSFSDLEAAFAALSESPESETLQQNALEMANRLTHDFQNLSTEATQIRVRADQEISRQVTEVNDAISSIDSLNAEIRSAQSAGRDTSALEDQRQRLVDRVSSIVPIREITREGGEIDIITQEGVFLLSGNPIELSFERAPLVGPGQTFEGGQLNGVFAGNIELTPTSDQPLRARGGSLAAQFEIRDRIGPEFGAQLDSLAADLIRRFSDPVVDPTLTGGAPGLFTDNGAALAVAPAPGLASRIAVNSAVDPSRGGLLTRFRDGVGASAELEAGDSTIVESILGGIRERKSIDGPGFGGVYSLVDAAADFSSLRASRALAAERTAATSNARTAGLVEAEQDIGGVDTDYELQELLRVEQAYQANARVIQVIDEMLGRLLEI